MKLVFDEKKFSLYSIGEDKKFVSIDLASEAVLNKLVLPGNKLTDMVINYKSQQCFVSDKDASIFVVSLSKKYPELF